MTQYDTYIFDLDGTLLATLDDLAASTNYALAAHGMPRHSTDDIRRFVGNGVRKLMERAVPDGENNPLFEDTLATFRQHYSLHSLDNTRPYPHVEDMLRELRRRGKRIAVVSNKFYSATQQLCHHFFPDTVEVAIGEREGIMKNLHPILSSRRYANSALTKLGQYILATAMWILQQHATSEYRA